jgi:tetratricopeptide (TPR) repeat protein
MSLSLVFLAWAALGVPHDPDTLGYEAHWREAIVLVDQGNYARAEWHAAQAVAENPLGADGHFALALAIGHASLTKSREERIRRATEIRTEALAAIELDPRHDGAYHILGRWNAEIMRLSGLSRFFARSFLGADVFKYASWEGAIDNLERAVGLDPTRIYHRLDLAEVYLDRKRFEEARVELERISSLPERDPLDAAHKARAAALLDRIDQS